MEGTMDLRTRKTYLALHNAFTELIGQKRFDELTVNELCDRAMIRRTTFYKHFADKYEYFTFYIREVVSTFQGHLAPDVMDAKVYFLHMARELLRFLQLHEHMVNNIKNSSMLPLLLSILLDQITEDAVMVLRRTSADLADDMEKLKGIAAFYAGGVLSSFFRLMPEEGAESEALFLKLIEEFTNRMLS